MRFSRDFFICDVRKGKCPQFHFVMAKHDSKQNDSTEIVQKAITLKSLKILQCMASTPLDGESNGRVAYGGERSTFLLCRGLVKRGHHVTLACPENSSFINFFKDAAFPVITLALSDEPLMRSWKVVLKLVRYLRQERPDLVVVQMRQGVAQAALACRLAGIPLLATCRSLKKPMAYRRANHIIAISEAVKHHLLEAGLRKMRIDVVYNGVNTEHFSPIAQSASFKAQLGLPPSQLVVGVVARLEREKGHAWFLRTAQKVIQRAPMTHFVFVGNGSEREALEKQAAELGIIDRLTFAGYHEDVTPWIAAIDILVLPSVKREGLGRVLLEAGAMGKPCIGTPIGGMNEVVSHEETGFIVPAEDESALFNALVKLIDDENLRSVMGAAGRKRIEEMFTLEGMIENTEAVYRRTIESRRTKG
jgi:glycosyltransferase involved in cell wall biosynthesis